MKIGEIFQGKERIYEKRKIGERKWLGLLRILLVIITLKIV